MGLKEVQGDSGREGRATLLSAHWVRPLELNWGYFLKNPESNMPSLEEVVNSGRRSSVWSRRSSTVAGMEEHGSWGCGYCYVVLVDAPFQCCMRVGDNDHGLADVGVPIFKKLDHGVYSGKSYCSISLGKLMELRLKANLHLLHLCVKSSVSVTLFLNFISSLQFEFCAV